jgi:hypothetical protein
MTFIFFISVQSYDKKNVHKLAGKWQISDNIPFLWFQEIAGSDGDCSQLHTMSVSQLLLTAEQIQIW